MNYIKVILLVLGGPILLLAALMFLASFDGFGEFFGTILVLIIPTISALIINEIINRKKERNEIKNLGPDPDLDSISDPALKESYSDPIWRIPEKCEEEEEKERRQSLTRFAIIWACMIVPAASIWMLIIY